MAEHVLRGGLQVAPGDVDGMRHILLLDGNELYRIPLAAEAASVLSKHLVMSDEELEAAAERANAAGRIVLPGQNGSAPNLN